MKQGPFTPDEDAYLIGTYVPRGMSLERIAAVMDRTPASVSHRLLRLRSRGLVEWRERVNGWTEEEDEYLYANWGVLRDEEVARRLGRTLYATVQRAYVIGVSKRENRAKATV